MDITDENARLVAGESPEVKTKSVSKRTDQVVHHSPGQDSHVLNAKRIEVLRLLQGIVVAYDNMTPQQRVKAFLRDRAFQSLTPFLEVCVRVCTSHTHIYRPCMYMFASVTIPFVPKTLKFSFIHSFVCLYVLCIVVCTHTHTDSG
jgi:hypothetical protein